MEVILNVGAILLATAIAVAFLFKVYGNGRRRGPSNLPPVPEIPGLPVVGNILQLKEKKPHKTFSKWAEIYGPIYSIRTGAKRTVVLNSNDVAKDAMVTRYSSISSRKLPNALKTLTGNKNMVVLSDYNDFYKTAKRHILTSLLGTSAQKRHRVHRDIMVENTVEKLHHLLRTDPHEAVNLRQIFQYELFALIMKEALGRNVESIDVEELGASFSSEQQVRTLVHDPLEGATEVDWRDLFPYLRWIPNPGFETKLQQVHIRRQAVMKSLIEKQKKRFESGEKLDCYLDYLLVEAKSYTDKQISYFIWETIIEASDTTMATTEWAMYEIAKNQDKQERLYQEILSACEGNKITEEKLCQLPYLSAIFQETMRKYSPVPLLFIRYVNEDTEIGGYFIPAGIEIAVNIYGCNMDKKVWKSPEEWKPERFLDGKYEQMDLYKTMAFGGGKRVCAGSLQAMLTSCMTIARLVQEFEWRLADGENDDVHSVGITDQKLNPLRAMIKPRN